MTLVDLSAVHNALTAAIRALDPPPLACIAWDMATSRELDSMHPEPGLSELLQGVIDDLDTVLEDLSLGYVDRFALIQHAQTEQGVRTATALVLVESVAVAMTVDLATVHIGTLFNTVIPTLEQQIGDAQGSSSTAQPREHRPPRSPASASYGMPSAPSAAYSSQTASAPASSTSASLPASSASASVGGSRTAEPAPGQPGPGQSWVLAPHRPGTGPAPSQPGPASQPNQAPGQESWSSAPSASTGQAGPHPTASASGQDQPPAQPASPAPGPGWSPQQPPDHGPGWSSQQPPAGPAPTQPAPGWSAQQPAAGPNPTQPGPGWSPQQSYGPGWAPRQPEPQPAQGWSPAPVPPFSAVPHPALRPHHQKTPQRAPSPPSAASSAHAGQPQTGWHPTQPDSPFDPSQQRPHPEDPWSDHRAAQPAGTTPAAAPGAHPGYPTGYPGQPGPAPLPEQGAPGYGPQPGYPAPPGSVPYPAQPYHLGSASGGLPQPGYPASGASAQPYPASSASAQPYPASSASAQPYPASGASAQPYPYPASSASADPYSGQPPSSGESAFDLLDPKPAAPRSQRRRLWNAMMGSISRLGRERIPASKTPAVLTAALAQHLGDLRSKRGMVPVPVIADLVANALRAMAKAELDLPPGLVEDVTVAAQEYPQIGEALQLLMNGPQPEPQPALLIEAPPDIRLWTHGRVAERREYLAQVRERDPAQARELVTTSWPSLLIDEREAFISVIAAKPQRRDQSLLEMAFTDPSSHVRAAARSGLALLPDSSFATRVRDMASELVVVTHGHVRTLYPKQVDPRDGLDDVPYSADLGAARLNAVVAALPTSTWEWLVGVPASRLALLPGAHEIGPGLEAAAIRHHDMALADALLQSGRVSPELVATASPVQQTLYAAEDGTLVPDWYVEAVESWPQPWPNEVAGAVSRYLLEEFGHVPLRLWVAFATRVPDHQCAEMANRLRDGVPEFAPTPVVRMIRQVAAVLSTRATVWSSTRHAR